MDNLYSFLLDFFPLTDDIADQNRVLGESLQRAAIETLIAHNTGAPMLEKLERLRTLLRLSHDLGYTDGDVLRYLERQLAAVAEECRSSAT